MKPWWFIRDGGEHACYPHRGRGLVEKNSVTVKRDKRYTRLEKEMATHSSILAWRIPGMEEPGGRLSMGLHRVGHDWCDLAAAAAAAAAADFQKACGSAVCK